MNHVRVFQNVKGKQKQEKKIAEKRKKFFM